MDNPNTEPEEVKEDLTANPNEETENINDGQEESSVPDRYADLLEKVGEEVIKEEKPKDDEKPKEDKEATKKSEEDSEEEIIYDNDKITFKQKDETKELIRVDLGDGKFAFVPEELKAGYLMQSDYTKKTMELAEQRKITEAELAQAKQDKEIAFAIQYMDLLDKPFEEPEPLESDFLNDYEKYETDDDAKNAYRKAKSEWNEKSSKFSNDVKVLKQTISAVQEKNDKMLNDFKTKYGEEAFKEVYEKISNYINPFVFRQVKEYPPDAFELMYKGMKYDKDMEALKKNVKIETVKELNDKGSKAKVLRTTISQKKETPNYDMPDRYSELFKKIEK